MVSNYGESWQWMVLALGILLLAYTMIVVKEERQSYLDSAKIFTLQGFDLLIPSWWKKVDNSGDKLTFCGPRGEEQWTALFVAQGGGPSNLKDKLVKKIASKNIVMDSDHSLTTGSHWVKVEGTATENGDTRLYLSTCIVYDTTGEKYLYVEGRSPVLDGMVEGPYFENCLKLICK